MSHFHLKYCYRSGRARTNLRTTFFSEMEALDAAGLANATRGQEAGFYSIEACRSRACEQSLKGADAREFEDGAGAPRTRVPLRSRMVN